MAGNGVFPVSYQDPLYATLARAAEQAHNLPAGILDAIRTRGERSNANQVSSAGARTPYQFIPSTRNAMLHKYQVDPWANPAQATDAAAQLVAENHDRAGSWNDAVAMYEGGNHPGAFARQYAKRVGDFDNVDTSKPYYTGATDMALNPSLFPASGGVDPLAPEAPKLPVPVASDPGPSANALATAPIAAKKRGGILGALESVFMPDPSSRWAGALRDGMFNAKESQQNYLENNAKKILDLRMANQKLQQLQQHGEYQVVGNNVFHIKPDGTNEMITGPSGIDDKVKYAGMVAAMPEGPAKELMKSVILGNYGATPEGTAAHNQASIDAARARAGATTQAARIHAGATVQAAKIRSTPTLPPLPPGAKVIQ